MVLPQKSDGDVFFASEYNEFREYVRGRNFHDVRQYGAVGDSVTDDAAAFQAAIDAAGDPAYLSGVGGRVYVPPPQAGKFYRLANTLYVRRGITFGGGSGAFEFTKTTLKFDAGLNGFVVNRASLSADGGAGDYSVIKNLNIEAAAKTTDADGIQLQARAELRNLRINLFKRDGINIVSDGVSKNQNLWSVIRCRSYQNGRHGLFVDGPDSNAGWCIGLDSSSNTGWGVYDSSFLGNTYLGCHTQGNVAGSYKSDDPNARNVFLGCYAESDQPTASIAAPAMVIGGLLSPAGGGNFMGHGAGYFQMSPMRWENAVGAPTVELVLGSESGIAGELFHFKAGSDEPSGKHVFKYGVPALGWFGLQFAGAASGFALALSGQAAAEGHSKTWLPQGLYLGDGGTANKRRQLIGTAAPTSDTWTRGDIVWQQDPTAGGKAGFICVTGGTPGTWKPFGAIDA